MDPTLQELLDKQDDTMVEVLLKTADLQGVEHLIEVVSRFGDVVTARMRIKDIESVWEKVECLKAPRSFGHDPSGIFNTTDSSETVADTTYTPATIESIEKSGGSDTVMAILDWGFDFTHPDLRFPNGDTKFLFIWDQGAPYDGNNKYGYGRVISREQINQALSNSQPFQNLRYHPDPNNIFSNGTHGTHVAGIATQMAPQLDLIAVHLATGRTKGTRFLGDSVRIVEALDFVLTVVKNRPCTINMSVGSMGGSHTGKSLVESTIDHALANRAGLAICQSAGNYYNSKTHAQGLVTEHRTKRLSWIVDQGDRTTNELEVWYHPDDDFKVRLVIPDDTASFEVEFEELPSVQGSKQLTNTSRRTNLRLKNGRLIGRMYMRRKESTTGLNHIDIFLYANAPAGEWGVELIGKTIYAGNFHAWIERDGGCRECQSRFASVDVNQLHTIGSITGSRYGIVVGAYDALDSDNRVAIFSSAGSLLDDQRRIKPEILAPGVRVSAARSVGRGQAQTIGRPLTTKSGTSMAAPQVMAAVALLFESVPRQLYIQETRRLLIASTDPRVGEDEPAERVGHGILNIKKLIKMGRDYLKTPMFQGRLDSSYPTIDNDLFRNDEVCGVEELQEENLLDFDLEEDAIYMAEVLCGCQQDKANIQKRQVYPDTSFNGIPPLVSDPRVQRYLKSIFVNNKLVIPNLLFRIIATPGSKLMQSPLEGDIIVRLLPHDQLGLSLITDNLVEDIKNKAGNSLSCRLPGQYLQVLDILGNSTSSPLLRRLANKQGYLSLRQMLLRPAKIREGIPAADAEVLTSAGLPAEGLSWPCGSKAKLQFMQQVYQTNLQRSLRRGQFSTDVPPEDLAVIEGRFKARTEAAVACRRMFRDIRKAISRENRNVSIGLTSAYRSASRQFKLWNCYFIQRFYPQTLRYRTTLPNGRHGTKSAVYMARYVRQRIATPGFSNHNKGQAIDLLNLENGVAFRNRSNPRAVRKWKNSWLWNWLQANAVEYGFYQNTRINEPWHWEYRKPR